MLGQHGHFILYAEDKIPYAIDRYRGEAKRLYGVLDRQLDKTGAYVAGKEYTITDMACFPWVMTHKAQKFTLDDYPAIKQWFATVRARPEVQKGLSAAKEQFNNEAPVDPEIRKKMFGIGAGMDDQAKEIIGK